MVPLRWDCYVKRRELWTYTGVSRGPNALWIPDWPEDPLLHISNWPAPTPLPSYEHVLLRMKDSCRVPFHYSIYINANCEASSSNMPFGGFVRPVGVSCPS